LTGHLKTRFEPPDPAACFAVRTCSLVALSSFGWWERDDWDRGQMGGFAASTPSCLRAFTQSALGQLDQPFCLRGEPKGFSRQLLATIGELLRAPQ
jgi:hypothetical protein